MKWKWLAVGIILLFVGTSIISATAQNGEKPSLPTSSGHWLYVGGSGPGYYSKIQDAIDNASDGDTVYVYSGIYDDYYPNNSALIIINKSINLFGEDKNTTIILNGIYLFDTIRIEANTVNLSGFTIQGVGHSNAGGTGIKIYYPSKNINIYNNIITKHDNVILFYNINQGITDINIYDNSIVENGYGIGEDNSEHSLIEIYHNNFSKNKDGIEAGYNYSIYENLFSNNSIGISTEATGMKTYIHNNQFEKNNIGIRIYNSRQIHIYENNFINNDAQTSVERNVFLSQCITTHYCLYRQDWKNNYWDDSIKPNPKLITGHWIIYMWVWIPGSLPNSIQIANLKYYEFDWHPAQEPYDIPG